MEARDQFENILGIERSRRAQCSIYESGKVAYLPNCPCDLPGRLCELHLKQNTAKR